MERCLHQPFHGWKLTIIQGDLIFFIRFFTFLIGLLPLEMRMNTRNIKDNKEKYLTLMMFMMKTMNMDTMMIMITLV